jgi:hypothetical protein
VQKWSRKTSLRNKKDNRQNISSDIMERITEQPDVLENVITCDETRISSIRSRNEEVIDALEDTHFTENIYINIKI